MCPRSVKGSGEMFSEAHKIEKLFIVILEKSLALFHPRVVWMCVGTCPDIKCGMAVDQQTIPDVTCEARL